MTKAERKLIDEIVGHTGLRNCIKQGCAKCINKSRCDSHGVVDALKLYLKEQKPKAKTKKGRK